MINENLAFRYFQLALNCAKARDLSQSVKYARRSLLMKADDDRAIRLLGLCLYELGEVNSALKVMHGYPGFSDELRAECESTRETLSRAREFAGRKKWRKADALLRANVRQSVRVLNTRGCLKAAAGKYRQAARLFTLALEKDRGNHVAGMCLIQAAAEFSR